MSWEAAESVGGVSPGPLEGFSELGVLIRKAAAVEARQEDEDKQQPGGKQQPPLRCDASVDPGDTHSAQDVLWGFRAVAKLDAGHGWVDLAFAVNGNLVCDVPGRV